MTVPASAVTVGPTPQGDFTGITFSSSNPEFSGFISIVVNGTNTSAAEVGAAMVGVLNGSGSIAGATVVSSQQAAGASDTQLLNLRVTTNAPMTATELSNLILTLFGTNIQGGTVTALPVGNGESTSTTFRIVIQITYSASSPALVGVGVTTEANYPAAEGSLGGLLDGTNFGPTGTCSGNGTSATSANNAWPAYYNLSQASGGASSSICSNDFSAFLNIIAAPGTAVAAP